jgi:hypothetical protein
MKFREGQKKVLLVSNIPPLKTHGGAIRTVLLLELLIAIGYDVNLYLIYPFEWGPIPDAWLAEAREKYGLVNVHYYPLKNRYRPEINVIKWLRKQQSNYEQIIFRYEMTAFKCGFYFLNIPVIIDYDDFTYSKAESIKTKVRSTIQLAVAKLLKARAIVVEKAHLKYWAKDKALWLPNLSINAITTSHQQEVTKFRAHKPTLVSIGFQTKDLLSFIQSEWNKLKKSIPDLELFIISRNSSVGFDNLDGIFFMNNIEDLKPYYCMAWAQLLVSKQNYGTHIKILESILYKTPVISLRDSIRGYEDINKTDELIMTADDYKGLSNLMSSLLSNEKKIRNLSEEGFLKANEIFSFQKLAYSLRRWI